MNNPIKHVKCYVCDRYIGKSVNLSSIAWSRVAVKAVGLVRHKSCKIGSRRWLKSKWATTSNLRWLYTEEV